MCSSDLIGGILREGVAARSTEPALSNAAAALPRDKDEKILAVTLREAATAASSEEGISELGATISLVFVTLLLVACANLASLQLARAASRSHEIGVRLSLGASRARVVRQLLTESLLLSFGGTALGFAAAAIGMEQLHRYLFSRVSEFGIVVTPLELDWRIAAFCGLIAVLAGVSFGLLPALQSTTHNLVGATRREHSTFAGRLSQHRLRDLLLSTQVAASLALLIVAGLLVRNLQRLSHAEPGYELDRVMDLRFPEKITPEFVELLRRDPLVAHVSVSERAPLMGWLPRTAVEIGGQTLVVNYNQVDEEYFGVLGLAPVRGRLFTRQEAGARSRNVVVSEATARKLWPGEDPVGKLLRVPPDEGLEQAGSYEVIGVVPDVISAFLFLGKDASMVYVPRSAASMPSANIVLRWRGAAPAVVPKLVKESLQSYCRNHNPSTLCHTLTMRELAGMQRFPLEAASIIAAGLGMMALGLTCIGLFGVVSYGVAQRRREIGIRMAIGASSAHVVLQLLREAARRVLWGMAAGLPICLGLSKLAASTTLRLETFDAAAYLLTPAVMMCVTLMSALIPALRAALVDPTISLRQE